MHIVLTEFARRRLFGGQDGGTQVLGCGPDAFVTHLADHRPERWIEGYTPFCKLALYPNWTGTRLSAIPITAENEACMRSAYEARAVSELPVLTRWLEGIEVPIAAYLLVILYSAEQLASEGEPIEGDWGVVGCIAVDEPIAPPMAPITMLRNALGVEHGGSGVPLDHQAYLESVAYWSRHANVRSASSNEEGNRP